MKEKKLSAPQADELSAGTDGGRKKIAEFLKEWADVNKVYDFIAEVNGREKP